MSLEESLGFSLENGYFDVLVNCITLRPFYAGPYWRYFFVAGVLRADLRGSELYQGRAKNESIELWRNKGRCKRGRR